MTLAILATGDEIVHGDTLNTNAYAIANALSADGIPLGFHLTCSDKEQDLLDGICFLAKGSSTILSIGGLGPTSDDRTRFAFAKYFNLELVEYPEAVVHIQSRLARAGFPFDAGNRLQALFPPNATLLPNPHGTAMGCIFTAQDKLCVLLPGPPRECLPMFNDFVLPYLQRLKHSQKQLLSWQLFGVSEGQIALMLESALEKVDCQTGYRLDTPYLEFKVRCGANIVEGVKQMIDPLLAPYIISPPKQKASTLLRSHLLALGRSVVIIDKATGGILETLLRTPETTHMLTFHQGSEADFYFEMTGLDAYWDDDKQQTTTDLLIKYHSRENYGYEHHSIPYRGHSLVLHYAAEWISFRMIALIHG